MIRPAKCYFNGFMKPFIKGADKNHNPRKGTETVSSSRLMILSLIVDKNHNPRKGTETSLPAMCPSIRTVWIRTIIPARGRKPEDFAIPNIRRILIRTIIPVRGRKIRRDFAVIVFSAVLIRTIIPARGRKHFLTTFLCTTHLFFDKNHNPRKGTGKKKAAQSSQFPLLGEC